MQVDDDVYLRPPHLVLATKQWRAMQAGEGCLPTYITDPMFVP